MNNTTDNQPPNDKVSVIIPMFNERDSLVPLSVTLAKMQEKLATFQLEFILVDDGSTDDTAERVSDIFGGHFHYKLVGHDVNRGIAAAIMTGARAADSEIICSMDCDGTYDACQLETLIPMLNGADVAMVTGSPYRPDGNVLNVPLWRLALSRLASSLYRAAVSRELHTYTSCFRVYRRSILLKLPIRREGFVGISEVIWQLNRRGYQIRECPSNLDTRRYGQSKMRTAQVALGHLNLLRQVTLDRIGRRLAKMILSAS